MSGQMGQKPKPEFYTEAQQDKMVAIRIRRMIHDNGMSVSDVVEKLKDVRPEDWIRQVARYRLLASAEWTSDAVKRSRI